MNFFIISVKFQIKTSIMWMTRDSIMAEISGYFIGFDYDFVIYIKYEWAPKWIMIFQMLYLGICERNINVLMLWNDYNLIPLAMFLRLKVKKIL